MSDESDCCIACGRELFGDNTEGLCSECETTEADMIVDNLSLASAVENLTTPPAPRELPPGKSVITVRMTPELKKRIDDRVAKMPGVSLNTFCVEAITGLLDYWDAEDEADAAPK